MKRLVAGPWVGEFGWELMNWQAWLRKQAREYDHVTVCAPAGHEALYKDFAHEYIEHNLRGQASCAHLIGADVQVRALDRSLCINGAARVRPPRRMLSLNDQTFISYRRDSAVQYDVVIHARNRTHETFRQWSLPEWNEFVARIAPLNLCMAAIGTESLCPDGVDDKRNIPLPELIDLLCSSRCIFGPPSGPLHLAALCETPVLTWTHSGQTGYGWPNKDRFTKHWNPLNTPCFVFEVGGWNPTVPDAVEWFLKTYSG